MAYKNPPYPINFGGTSATTASGARTALSVPLNTNTMLLDGTQGMAASLNMNTNKIVNLVDPTNPQDGATKNYVDSTAQGLSVKLSCRFTSTANITLSGTQTIDGVSVNVGDRGLVQGQSSGATNGIYVVASGSWTRSTDAAVSADVTSGIFTFIEEGTVNAGSGFVLTTPGPITLGTTALTFTQFSGAGEVINGNGLTKSGNTLAVGQGTGIQVNSTSVQISPTYVGQTSITTLGTIATGTWTGTNVSTANGGTGSSSASGARSNLSAAPNTPIYWTGATNSELGNAVQPSSGTGMVVTAATGVIAVDTTVVATTSNTLTMSGKTLTTPTINNPQTADTPVAKTGSYTILAANTLITFTISSGSTASLPASSGVTSGKRYTIKNKAASTANLTLATTGADTGENSTITSSGGYLLAPGDAIDAVYDGSEWIIV